MRSRLEPMKKMARMLRSHEALLMNWFHARGELPSAAVEGLNNKVRVVTRRSYGFRTYNGIEVRYITRLDDYPNRRLPTDFADEAKES
jgi:transposase